MRVAAPHSSVSNPRIIVFYLEVHKIHQFCDLRLKDLHSFLINFHSIRLLVTFHLGINMDDIKKLQHS